MAKLTSFQVTNFRTIHNSGWIDDIGQVTALLGQNESGKSNLCEALYKLYPFDDAKYDFEFDWPVDLWEKKNRKEIVCRAKFALTDAEAATTSGCYAAEKSKRTNRRRRRCGSPESPRTT